MLSLTPAAWAQENSGWPAEKFKVLFSAPDDGLDLPPNAPDRTVSPQDLLDLIRTDPSLTAFFGDGNGGTTRRFIERSAMAAQVEADLNEIASIYRAAGFPPPKDMPTIMHEGEPHYVAFTYDFSTVTADFGEDGDAGLFVEPRCEGESEIFPEFAWFALNQDLFAGPPEKPAGKGGNGTQSPSGSGADFDSNSGRQTVIDREVYDTLAHELFHAIQYSWAPESTRCDDMNEFVVEGTAQAVGNLVTDARYPGYINNSSLNGILGRRDYSTKIFAADESSYTTSAFWRYLMETHGGLSVTDQLRLIADVYTAGGDFEKLLITGNERVDAGNGLNWLESALTQSRVRTPLYIEFPNFLAYYARLGKDRYTSASTKNWDGETLGFDGDKVCAEETLTPDNALMRTTPVTLEPATGVCLRLKVDGLKEGQSARIKFMVLDNKSPLRRKADLESATDYTDSLEGIPQIPASVAEKLDSVHLSMARLGGTIPDWQKGDFNCYRKTPPGSSERMCLGKPYLGARIATDDFAAFQMSKDYRILAKVWGSPRRVFKEAFEDTYVVSNVPLAAQTSGQKYSYKFLIGLEVTEGETSESGPLDDPYTSTTFPGPNEPVRMRGTGGPEQLAPDPESMSRMMFGQTDFIGEQMRAEMSRAANDGETPKNLFLFYLDEQIDEPAPSGINALIAVDNELEGIPFQATGSYPVVISGFQKPSFDLGSTLTPISNKDRGTLRILEFNDDILRYELDTKYCRNRDRVDKGDDWTCRQPQTLTASGSLPFGWTHDTRQIFVSLDSPGMAAYRQHHKEMVFGRQPSTSLPGGMQMPDFSQLPGMGGAPQGDGSAGSASCACTCDEYDELIGGAEAMSQDMEDNPGMIPDMSGFDMNRMLTCMTECAGKYDVCEQ